MSNWSVYLECQGNPLYASVELDDWDEDDPLTEEDAWDMVREMVLQTLEVTKED